MENKIAFIHTTGAWWDHRYYFKQMPALIKAGFEVTYFIKTNETIENIDLKVIKIPEKLTRLIRVSGGMVLLSRILKSKIKIIQICNLELLPLGIVLALLFRKKVFYDCREDHFNAMLYNKPHLSKWMRFLIAYSVRTIESIASKVFKGFIVSDPAIYKMYNNLNTNRKMLFYNMPLASQFIFNDNINQNTERIYDLVVLGSMSIRTGVLTVVKALAVLKENNIILALKLIGDPKSDAKLWEEITKEINQHELSNQITITGQLKYDEIPSQLYECRIGIIPLLDLPKFRNNIATKQFEYMACGLPVIASDLPPQRIFIKNDINGVFYIPGDVNDLVEKILFLLKEPDKIRLIGDSGQSLIKNHWNAEEQSNKYTMFYNYRLTGKKYFENQLPPISFE